MLTNVILLLESFRLRHFMAKKSNSGGYILVEEADLQIHPCSFSIEGRGKRDNHYNYLLCLSNAVREHLLDLEKASKKLITQIRE